MFVKDISELIIYKTSVRLKVELTTILSSIPHYCSVPEVNQVLRSSSSIAANIA